MLPLMHHLPFLLLSTHSQRRLLSSQAGSKSGEVLSKWGAPKEGAWKALAYITSVQGRADRSLPAVTLEEDPELPHQPRSPPLPPHTHTPPKALQGSIAYTHTQTYSPFLQRSKPIPAPSTRNASSSSSWCPRGSEEFG